MRLSLALIRSLATTSLLYNAVPTLAQDAGSIIEVGETLVSAMMVRAALLFCSFDITR